jgi:CheY-like chemotaxis protein
MNAILTEPETTETALRPRNPDDDVTAASDPRARILYAEDDPSLRYAARLMLGRAGYAVDAVADGAEAWLALQGRDYDLLITDNNMPRLKGVELIGKLRRARLDVPVILASSSVDELPWPSCDALLSKPFSVEQLLSVVSGVLGARAEVVRAQRQLCLRAPAGFQFTDQRRQGLAAGG